MRTREIRVALGWLLIVCLSVTSTKTIVSQFAINVLHKPGVGKVRLAVFSQNIDKVLIMFYMYRYLMLNVQREYEIMEFNTDKSDNYDNCVGVEISYMREPRDNIRS